MDIAHNSALLGRHCFRRLDNGWSHPWVVARWLAVAVTLVFMLSQSADAEHPFGLSKAAVERGGSLVLAGGGALPESVYSEFVRLAGGRKSRLVIIPSAHPFDSVADAERAYRGWYDTNVRSVSILHADDFDEADQEEFVEPLRRATGVWFGGGAQGRLADRYVDSRVEVELKRLLARGGVVGGTSAGASIVSRTMIRYGSRTEAVTDRGLGLVSNAVVDQHFLTRQRQPRLIGVLQQEPDQWGVGIDERTAVVIRRNQIRVLGDSRVVLCRGATTNRPAWVRQLEPGEEYDLESLLPTAQP